jgi:hypothetical protein
MRVCNTGGADEPFHSDSRWSAHEKEEVDMAQIDERVALLEKQQALQTEALRLILEGQWQGAEGAAGVVVALSGEELDAKPFPGD